MNLEVLFTPADFAALGSRDLKDTACVVFDVFRATSTMITALANGASAIIPAGEISEALAIRKREPKVLLGGERDGLRIRAALTGGIDFDFGNSPREFTKDKVAGKIIVMTTTNGTQALRACARAKQILIGSFLNLQATADFLARQIPENLVIVCSGTFDQAACEDVLAAGALCDVLWERCEGGAISDSAQMSRALFQLAQSNLLNAAQQSRNGRRLSSRPELREDVPFCLQRNIHDFVAMMQPDGKITKV
jgi:2-phosphosulfolactate phosphatase